MDIIVVGAGALGATLAAALGHERRYKVLCIERDWSEPNRIVGELLQPGGVRWLKRLGLVSCLEGIDAQKIHGYGVFFKGDSVALPYPVEENDERPCGYAFHHGRFISKLREATKSAPNVTCVEGTVVDLWEQDGRVMGVRYKQGSNEYRAHAFLTIAVDGVFSRLRKDLTKTTSLKSSTFAGIVLEGVQLPFANHGHVVLCNPSPVLVYPISSTEARMLIDIPNDVSADPASYATSHIAPQLPAVLREALEQALRTQKLRVMPASYMPGIPRLVPGALALGDAFNLRHPLTGAGMTVAFADGHLLREMLRDAPDLANREATLKHLAAFYDRRKAHASTSNILANALYAVFCGKDDEFLPYMQEACFKYFTLGDFAVNGTMAMLGALNTNPYFLFSHFFSVAALGMYDLLAPFPYPSRIATAFGVLKSAAQVIKPLIDNENVTVLANVPNFLLGVKDTLKAVHVE